MTVERPAMQTKAAAWIMIIWLISRVGKGYGGHGSLFIDRHVALESLRVCSLLEGNI
jgi:hypothetical protein